MNVENAEKHLLEMILEKRARQQTVDILDKQIEKLISDLAFGRMS